MMSRIRKTIFIYLRNPRLFDELLKVIQDLSFPEGVEIRYIVFAHDVRMRDLVQQHAPMFGPPGLTEIQVRYIVGFSEVEGTLQILQDYPVFKPVLVITDSDILAGAFYRRRVSSVIKLGELTVRDKKQSGKGG